MTRYILTATSGNIGSRTLHHILEKQLIAPEDLIISASTPDRVPAIAREHNVEIRQGNFTDLDSLKTSFEGGDVLFLISHPDAGVARVGFHKNAIDAAKSAGVKTVIYASMMFGGETGLDTVIGIQHGHVGTVKYLETAGIDYIVARQGIYAQGWYPYAGFQPRVFHKGETEPFEWVTPNDGAVAFVDWNDLTEGNARILAEYTKYVGQTLRLTGPRATKVSEIAKLVEDRTGRKVNLRFVGKEEAIRYHKENHTLPDSQLDFLENNWGGWFEGLANGEGEVVDPFLAQLLGRPVKGIEELADDLFAPR